ncbi:hypothetical protein MPTK1_3g25070 [Marchantia polymorpha subsp. ruderalis]|uniref:Uncharacterized protein n=2 Tax=Marchantia polymorpha TaxID=3197 RepID=A0AAF6B4J5_MARPO|nr:hypothetical protein MARPO_0100s0020 [Marchantia polymorpha]BBN06929.1 hypothetical protein Mp_3g25070 [Marchantia polymorpha subsp. ruderalis]|eukprot:PTQ32306.1 hypothetical protein MARPO_0100s0020 [Marchantia polymorpha]
MSLLCTKAGSCQPFSILPLDQDEARIGVEEMKMISISQFMSNHQLNQSQFMSNHQLNQSQLAAARVPMVFRNMKRPREGIVGWPSKSAERSSHCSFHVYHTESKQRKPYTLRGMGVHSKPTSPICQLTFSTVFIHSAFMIYLKNADKYNSFERPR